MRDTNSRGQPGFVALLSVFCITVWGPVCSVAQEVKLHKALSTEESRCLSELFHHRYFQELSDNEIRTLTAETTVVRADLKGGQNRAFIFVVHDVGWCGSAGCLMLIGERGHNGKCHFLGAASGAIEHLASLNSRHLLDERKGETVEVLDHRDHGYRRLYAPCKLYFDGRQYQQVHEECPNDDVRR